LRTEHLATWGNDKQEKLEHLIEQEKQESQSCGPSIWPFGKMINRTNKTKHAKHESEGCGPSLWHFGEMIKQEELQTRETNGETG